MRDNLLETQIWFMRQIMENQNPLAASAVLDAPTPFLGGRYPNLHQVRGLEKRGLIREIERRGVFDLTDKGRALLSVKGTNDE